MRGERVPRAHACAGSKRGTRIARQSIHEIASHSYSNIQITSFRHF